MPSQSDTTTLPSPEVQEQNKPSRPSGKKSRKEEDALEKLAMVVRVGDRRQIFDLAVARRREAERRLRMLGEFAHVEFDKKRLRAFARERFVPERMLTSWKHNYLLHGLEGLLPQDWGSLSEKAQQKVLMRLVILGELVDAVTITGDNVYTLSKKFDGENKFRVAERLVRRYQIDGG